MNGWQAGIFIGRRLLAMVGLLFLLSFGVFLLIYLAPGDPVDSLLPLLERDPTAVAAVEEKYHLNDSFLQQYWLWLQNALQFDLGDSTMSQQPVTRAIQLRVGVSLFLGLYAFVLAMVFGITLGILSALRRRSSIDRGIVAASIVGVSTPAFVSATLLIFLFSVQLTWFPAFGPGDGFTGRLYHLTLPAVAIAIGAMTLVLRLTRAALIGVLEQDYITFAVARGVRGRLLLVGYLLRNGLIPVVTAGGILLAGLLTGAVIVENVFGIPGIGQLFLESIQQKDVPVVQGIVLVIGVVVIVVNLLTDLLYVAVDPRIRFEGATV